MTLGPDRTKCATQLSEAMRAELDKRNPPAGSNVELEEVKANFGALGDGVWRILTLDAETTSASAQDSTFWSFVSTLRGEVEALRAFDAGLKAAVALWDPATPASGTALKAAIAALTVPPSTPAAPATLTGKIR